MILLSSFARQDKRQFVFLVQVAESDIRIVEAAELWEEPEQGHTGMCYFYYPTVFGLDSFETLVDALAAATQRYPWIGVRGEATA